MQSRLDIDNLEADLWEVEQTVKEIAAEYKCVVVK